MNTPDDRYEYACDNHKKHADDCHNCALVVRYYRAGRGDERTAAVSYLNKVNLPVASMALRDGRHTAALDAKTDTDGSGNGRG